MSNSTAVKCHTAELRYIPSLHFSGEFENKSFVPIVNCNGIGPFICSLCCITDRYFIRVIMTNKIYYETKKSATEIYSLLKRSDEYLLNIKVFE